MQCAEESAANALIPVAKNTTRIFTGNHLEIPEDMTQIPLVNGPRDSESTASHYRWQRPRVSRWYCLLVESCPSHWQRLGFEMATSSLHHSFDLGCFGLGPPASLSS